MITQHTYAERRERLMKEFEDTDEVIFLRGATPKTRSADGQYAFRQDSNVRYLTGITEPDIAMLLVPKESKYILFAREHPAAEQVWTGKTPSLEELGQLYGADEVRPLDDVRRVMDSYAPAAIHSLKGNSAPFRTRRKALSELLYGMRIAKSPEEIAEMESAVSVAGRAFDAIMRATRPGESEARLEGIAELMWRSYGEDPSFAPIVTIEGAILHSERNRKTLVDGRMLLVDMGCELNGYCSDITRTFPVNGSFTPEQATIYGIVLQAKREATGLVRPGADFKDIDRHAMRVIAEGLREEGILTAGVDELLASGAVRLFYMHGLGHWLGMDCHDGSDFRSVISKGAWAESLILSPGKVITIEPGIYFNELLLNDQDKVEQFKGMVDFGKARSLMGTVSGIRIEDDVLVTDTGRRVLGPGIPEEPDELEALVGAGGADLLA